MFSLWNFFSIILLIAALFLAIQGWIHLDSFFIQEAILMAFASYLAYKEYQQLKADPFFKGDPFHTRKRKLFK